MEELKNKTIVETFKAKLETPWIWLVIVLTIGLTVLFYFSQKPQIVVYSQYIKSLSEYQLLESSLLRSMERVRTGYTVDTMLIQSQTMTLREMAVSFSREMDELNVVGSVAPPSYATDRFEKEVLSKVAGIRRYVQARSRWIEKWDSVMTVVLGLPAENSVPLNRLLDSARAGFPVVRSQDFGLSDTLVQSIDKLLSENSDLALAWGKFDNEVALMNSVDLIQFFQMQNLSEISLKSKVPMVFYFLSLVLLLSTFFFLFRSRL